MIFRTLLFIVFSFEATYLILLKPLLVSRQHDRLSPEVAERSRERQELIIQYPYMVEALEELERDCPNPFKTLNHLAGKKHLN